jgi:hypothetical protein
MNFVNEAHMEFPVVYEKNVLILDASKDAELGLNHKFVFWNIDCDFLMNFADRLDDGSYKVLNGFGPHDLPY